MYVYIYIYIRTYTHIHMYNTYRFQFYFFWRHQSFVVFWLILIVSVFDTCYKAQAMQFRDLLLYRCCFLCSKLVYCRNQSFVVFCLFFACFCLLSQANRFETQKTTTIQQQIAELYCLCFIARIKNRNNQNQSENHKALMSPVNKFENSTYHIYICIYMYVICMCVCVWVPNRPVNGARWGPNRPKQEEKSEKCKNKYRNIKKHQKHAKYRGIVLLVLYSTYKNQKQTKTNTKPQSFDFYSKYV